jgi:hypothetical protein
MSQEEAFKHLDNELGFSFSFYIIENTDSPLLEPLYDEPRLVFLTDDQDFNAWALQSAARAQRKDDVVDRPTVLYHVSVPYPPSVEGVDWGKAKFLCRVVMKPAQEPLKAAG